MKKILCITLIAAVMLTSLGTTASASSTIVPARGDLVIHKYAITSPVEPGDPGTGESTTVPSGAMIMQNVGFRVFQIDMYLNPEPIPVGIAKELSVAYEYVDNKLKVTAIDLTADAGTPVETYYNVTEVNTGGGVSIFPENRLTDTSGTVTFAGLPNGFYFVFEDPQLTTEPKVMNEETGSWDNVSISSVVTPFVVAVPMTNATGDGWLTEVHVYPKNEPVTITKTSDRPSVSIGDIITYTITIPIPYDITTAQAFRIFDNLDPALDLVPGSVVVDTYIDGNWQGVLPSGLYSVEDNAPHTLHIEFMSGLSFSELAAFDAIIVSFKAAVNASLVEAANPPYSPEDREIDNTATLEFVNEFGHIVTPRTPIDIVHTGRIEIRKTDSTGAPLGDALFQIADSYENAVAGLFLRKTMDGNIVRDGDSGYVGAAEWIEFSDTVTGLATFEGLRDSEYENPGNPDIIRYLTYYIVEIAAPSGYNLFTEPIEVMFDELSNAATIYTATVDIVNSSQFLLPLTGGVGTIIFTIAGIVLIGLSIILLITAKKKKNRT